MGGVEGKGGSLKFVILLRILYSVIGGILSVASPSLDEVRLGAALEGYGREIGCA
jgi:hypothetical protein